MTEPSVVDQLNSIQYVYLRKLSEPRDNSLRVIVEEARVNRSGVVVPPSPELTRILTETSPIESTSGGKTFELHWNLYVAYLVTEEMVGSCGSNSDEVYTGRILRVYTKSHFLDHIARDTGGHSEPVQHFKLVCLNHLIDVAAYSAPETRVSLSEESS